MAREQPCPYRIVDDFGGAFAMGCFAGCIFYFFRGMYFSPKNERFYGGIQLLKRRSPVLGGSFALWGGLFSMTDCALIHLRQKEDWINPVLAGTFTGGFLAVRAGWRIAARNAIFGGLILGMIQLVEVYMIKSQMKREMQMQQEMKQQQLEMLNDQLAQQQRNQGRVRGRG
ncbi:hypothetical protein pb186bvf_017338 [Paramecium bursaria]